MSSSLWVQGGRVIDPGTGTDEVKDLFIHEGRMVEDGAVNRDTCTVVDARDKLVTPGFWDIHVHLREPGGEAQETIETGSLSAARGGFTRIVAMPNTVPAIDSAQLVRDVEEKGLAAGHCGVVTSACITMGRAGQVVADLPALAAAGAVAFTDDGCTVMDDDVMRRAMEIAQKLNIPVMDHAQDSLLEQQGVMHAGEASARFGLPGIPSEAEATIVARDIRLAEETGCHLHIQHVTAKESVTLIRDAMQRGVHVSGEASPHHLVLTDEDIDPANASFKMNPPLRTAADRDALRAGVTDHSLAVLATDHAPHTAEAKARGFLHGPFGVLGLETAIGLTYDVLVQHGSLSLSDWVSRWTTAPAKALLLPPPSLQCGQPADLSVLDLRTPWTVNASSFASKSRNTPFDGWTLNARAVTTCLGGKLTWVQENSLVRPPASAG